MSGEREAQTGMACLFPDRRAVGLGHVGAGRGQEGLDSGFGELEAGQGHVPRGGVSIIISLFGDKL